MCAQVWEALIRGWDGWMASLTGWTWVWVNSESWWWTRRPGVLRFMGSQRVGQTEWLNWLTVLNLVTQSCCTPAHPHSGPALICWFRYPGLSCAHLRVRNADLWINKKGLFYSTGNYIFGHLSYPIMGFPGGSVVKNPPVSVGDVGLIPGFWKYSGRGHGNSLQYPCLENPMDRGAWWATFHGVTKSWTQLSNSMHAISYNGRKFEKNTYVCVCIWITLLYT